MNEQRNNGRGIFYGVIGVATLVVAIIGATFAYFTATASNNVITGNMATVRLSLAVTKVTDADEAKGGMIPMSNGMVEQAVNKGYTETEDDEEVTRVCVDDNGNAVCQIYKITITNDSTAGQFVDGYVALRGGSGAAPTDLPTVGENTYTYVDGAKFAVNEGTASPGGNGTTMRWAQVFETAAADDNKYTTAGTQNLGAGGSEQVVFSSVLGSTTDPKDLANIRTNNALMSVDSTRGVLTPVTIAGTEYNVIGTNYIRLSNHAWAESGVESYDRTADITSALVFNHSIAAGASKDYYVVVWLSETGTNQTPGATVGDVTNPAAANFFLGNVTFVSAQGSEVSATFSGYTRVPSDSLNTQD